MVLCMPSVVGRGALVLTRWSATTPTATYGSLRSRTRWLSPVLLWWPWMGFSMWLVGKTVTFFPIPRVHHFFIFHFLVGGAVLEDGDGTDLAQVYNPKSGAWTELAPMQIARSGSAACTLKGKIYVIGKHCMHTKGSNKGGQEDQECCVCSPRRVARLDGEHG